MDLAYQSYGAGEPLILLHGLFGSRDNWHTLGRKLGERFHVFAVDQRNHGASPHDDRMDYAAMADDLREFMASHSLPSTRLLGHSMGGKTAMQFALCYPDAVERLLVADIAPKAYPGHHDEIFDAMRGLDLAAAASRPQLDAALAVRVPDIATRQLIMKSITRDPGGAFTWKLNFPAIERHYDEIMGNVDAPHTFRKPTLFVRGERSQYIQDADLPAIKAWFPAAQVQVLPGAGHWLHAEKPAEFLQIVSAFFA